MSSQHWDEAREEERLREMERESEALDENSTNYYATLNVSRTASTEEIRNAYRHLSRLFHPDKQHDSQSRDLAQRQFHKISRAYEVLIDPRTRDAYDQLGEKGIKMSKALGFRVQSPKDLQNIFEQEARRFHLEQVERWAQSKSEISFGLATTPITSPTYRMLAERFPNQIRVPTSKVNVGRIYMNHSFSTELGKHLSAKITGHMSSHGNTSSKNVIGTLIYSPTLALKMKLSVPALPPHTFTLNMLRNLSTTRYVQATIKQHTLDFSTPPSVKTTFGKQFSDTVAGSLMISTGNQYNIGPLWSTSPLAASNSLSKEQSPVSLGRIAKREQGDVVLSIARHHGKKRFFTLMAGAKKNAPFVRGSYTRLIDKYFSVVGDFYLVGVGMMQTNSSKGSSRNHGINRNNVAPPPKALDLIETIVSIEFQSTISHLSKLSWKVSFGISSGVSVTLGFSRLEHSVEIPVLLTPLPEAVVTLCAVALPATAMLGFNYAFVKPRRRRIIQQRMNELKDEQRHQLYQQKRNALEAVRVMKDVVERNRKNALATGGLFIEKAHYGDLPFDITAENSNGLLAALDRAQNSRTALSEADEPRACDVTVALQALINDNQLVISEGGSKRFLPGFYDPAFGVPKMLFVRYRFKGKLHEVVVKDSQALAIPMRVHCIE
ncbi:hypothetical protein LPJ72_002035 [Coemansia sp. Benny D160-2]|nr:hypothetical protein LPJ72_002035 [Coemansia sp. Benny D160-2]